MRYGPIATGIAVLALAVAVGAVIVLLGRPRTTVAATDPIAVRHITVVGGGKATAPPDTAHVQIGVRTEADTAQAALQDNNTRMTALIAKIKELGVEAKDIQTSNLSISPRYDNQGRNVTGYEVNNMVSVTIRNIAQTGDMLDQVVQAGANSLYGISFTIDDPSAVQQQARDNAIADARARAAAMAQSAGVTVGPILSITENLGATPQPMFRAAAMAEAADASVPIESGEQTINAQVQVTFELQ